MERKQMQEAVRSIEQTLHEAGTRIGYGEFYNVSRLLKKVHEELNLVTAEVEARKTSSAY